MTKTPDRLMPVWTFTLGRFLAIGFLFTQAVGTVSSEALMLFAVMLLSIEYMVTVTQQLYKAQAKTREMAVEAILSVACKNPVCPYQGHGEGV